MRGLLIRKWLLGSLSLLFVLPLLASLQLWNATHCSPYDAVRSNLHALDMQIQSFSIDTHQWPRTLRALVEDDGTPGWHGPYARASNLKDPWGGDVQYVVPAGRAPVLSTRGRNKTIVTHEMDVAAAP